MTAPPRIVIIGAGPTGLAAGYRLRELGYTDFVILEATANVGGLAGSERSSAGFTYDIGGHVLFSHYEYFDRLFARLMGDDFRELDRKAWIRAFDRFIPYPFQNNIKHLPREVILECILGLVDAQKRPVPREQCSNFGQLICATFGTGIAKHFMLPYNEKVWAHPPEMLSTSWVGERVSVVSLEQVLRDLILDRDGEPWGPNNKFKYPRGGVGQLFQRMAAFVGDQLRLGASVVRVDADRNEVVLSDGSRERYDALLSTMPLDQLVNSLTGDVPERVRDSARALVHSGAYIVGVGVNRRAPGDKCWIYFPEGNCPFYRVTYLSNYSPYVVPDASRQYSLLAEVSFSTRKVVDREGIADDTIRGMLATTLLSPEDLDAIADVHLIEREYTYPVPTVDRDTCLAAIHPYLESRQISSRGRFGAWRYEVGNVDHAVAQGVEWVDRILLGKDDDELTWQAKRGC